MLILTGDTHGKPDQRIGLIQQKGMDHLALKKNYLIILGDFGAIWKGKQDQREASILNYLDSMPWTTLFLDGNHENHERLDKLHVAEMFGGRVGVASESVFHLRRGEIYILDGIKTFVFGGAASIDKLYRQEGLSWWPREIPSKAEEDFAIANLEKHGNKVDLILTHTMPLAAVEEFKQSGKSPQGLEAMAAKAADPVPAFLQHIYDTVAFDVWFCGHFHVNMPLLNGKVRCLYDEITSVCKTENKTQ